MALSTGLVVALAAGAGLAYTTRDKPYNAAAAPHRQEMAQNRAETQAKNIARTEEERQRKQAGILAAQEKQGIARADAALRSTAGRRSGRRSLLSGSEMGVASPQLGQKQTLG